MRIENISTAELSKVIYLHHPLRNFILHFLAMLAVIFIGMLALAAIFTLVVSIWGMTWWQGREQFPQLFLFAMAVGMTVPVVTWMRYRHQTWITCSEMVISLFVPGIIFIGYTSLPAVSIGSISILYSALMIPLMLAPMLLRRDEYSQDHLFQTSNHAARP